MFIARVANSIVPATESELKTFMKMFKDFKGGDLNALGR